ncbi:MAG: TetR/AcrR family transcriptional regulator [Firmicutes bacterium]|nr:TetR/AcrR family transcriptional regulator [Bacillota bacterium]
MENEKTNKRPDRRVLRTKSAIQHAFARLLAEKGMNEITVSELAEEADISRKSFYNYYSGIHEVKEEIENDILSSLEELVSDLHFTESLRDPYLVNATLGDIIRDDVDFFGNIAFASESDDLVDRIIRILKNQILKTNPRSMTREEMLSDIVLEFLIYGMLHVYRMWFASDRSLPLETFTGLVSVLQAEGLKGAMQFMNREG